MPQYSVAIILLELTYFGHEVSPHPFAIYIVFFPQESEATIELDIAKSCIIFLPVSSNYLPLHPGCPSIHIQAGALSLVTMAAT